MAKELDKDARCFDKPFHIVMRGPELEFLIPQTYNSKIENVKRKYQQIDGEHFLFLKNDGHIQIDPPAGHLEYSITLSTVEMRFQDYISIYGAMYEDISSELPDDLQLPITAFSVQPALPGTISCQLVISCSETKAVLMSATVPKKELDEFMELAEYIKVYDGEIPKESDKDGYKKNTFHPEIIYNDDIDDEEELSAELDKYDDEDHDDYNSNLDHFNIIVSLEDKEAIRRVLNNLIATFDEQTGFAFGQKVKGEFEEYMLENENIGYGSEIPFFAAASKFPELHKKIIEYIDLAIDADGPWLDDEVPKGLNAAFALAYTDEKFIPKYIELLKVVDMDHEVYQLMQILVLVEKWKEYDNGLKLLGARCMNVSGQHGLENLSYFLEMNPSYISDRTLKEKLFKMIMFATLDNRYYYQERYEKILEYPLSSILEQLEIDYDETKFIRILAVMHENALPGLDDII